MAASPAPAARAALTEASQRWPSRNRASDGLCGDAAHAARASDHNPDTDGLCCAFDLTHDPERGVDCNYLAEYLRTIRDPRVKYVIWNRRIWNPSTSPSWRPYSGINPHTKHMHVSITQAGKRDTRLWWEQVRVQTAGTTTQGDYVKPQPPPPPVQLPGGKMRQLVAVGPLDSSGRGWAGTDIPFAGFEAATVNAVNPETSGYGPPVVVHAMNWDEKVRLVVMDGKPGSSVGVYVTTAT